MEKAWLGIDAGKEFHYWAHVLDASGTELLSHRVENDRQISQTDIANTPRRWLRWRVNVLWAMLRDETTFKTRSAA